VGNAAKVYVSYPNLAKDVKPGERVFLDDGKMEVKVMEIINDQEVKMSVTLGGLLLPKKGVNLPDSALSMPSLTEKDIASLTEKDIADLEFIIEQKLDWVALSFVRSAEDITNLKSRIKAKNSKIKTIAKM